MKHFLQLVVFLCIGYLCVCPVASAKDINKHRWTEQRANEWYSKLPWLVGCN